VQGSKSKDLYDHPTPDAPVARVAVKDYTAGLRAETMCWPETVEERAVTTTILTDDAAAKRGAELLEKTPESKAGSGTSTCWMDRS